MATNTKIEMKEATSRVNLGDYAREILAVKKNVLKFSISDQEVLSDVLDQLFGQRITNVNDNVLVQCNENARYNSKLVVKAYGKIYTVYSQVSENKLRLNTGK